MFHVKHFLLDKSGMFLYNKNIRTLNIKSATNDTEYTELEEFPCERCDSAVKESCQRQKSYE